MTTASHSASHRGAPPVRDHSAKRRWVGQSIRRVEDPKFLLGRGGYIADRITPGTLHAAVLRSPHPHARILRAEVAQAMAAPGVHAVITGRQAAELCDPLPDFGPDPARPSRNFGSSTRRIDWPTQRRLAEWSRTGGAPR